MNLRRIVFLTLISLAILNSTSLCYAISPEDALENPGLLPQLGEKSFLYTSYVFKYDKWLLAYSEYDEEVNGYGALLMRHNGTETIWSYLAAKTRGNIGVGLGIHKGTGSNWLMDLGWSYKNDILSASISLNDLSPINKGSTIDELHYKTGASVNVSSNIALGIDRKFSGTPSYTGHVTLRFSPNLKSMISFAEDDSKWRTSSVEVWMTYKGVLLNAAHEVKNDYTRLGLGVTF